MTYLVAHKTQDTNERGFQTVLLPGVSDYSLTPLACGTASTYQISSAWPPAAAAVHDDDDDDDDDVCCAGRSVTSAACVTLHTVSFGLLREITSSTSHSLVLLLIAVLGAAQTHTGNQQTMLTIPKGEQRSGVKSIDARYESYSRSRSARADWIGVYVSQCLGRCPG